MHFFQKGLGIFSFSNYSFKTLLFYLHHIASDLWQSQPWTFFSLHRLRQLIELHRNQYIIKLITWFFFIYISLLLLRSKWIEHKLASLILCTGNKIMFLVQLFQQINLFSSFSNSWVEVSPLLFLVTLFSLATCNGKLFVIGTDDVTSACKVTQIT